jgi:hypothetical protein
LFAVIVLFRQIKELASAPLAAFLHTLRRSQSPPNVNDPCPIVSRMPVDGNEDKVLASRTS